MAIIRCKKLNAEMPYIYNIQFIDRHNRRTNITCVEGYTFTVLYKNGSVVEKTGVIQRIELDEDNLHNSYLVLDITSDSSYGVLKIYFEQIINIRAAQVNDAFYIAVTHGFRGTLADWFRKMRGARGYSAYEIAVQNGFTGDEESWLDSIISNTKLEDLESLVSQINGTLTDDLSQLRDETTSNIASLREETSNDISGIREDMDTGITSIRNETSTAMDSLRAETSNNIDSLREYMDTNITSITEEIDEIKTSSKGKMINYEEGMEIPSDGSICAISVEPDQVNNIPITPGLIIIVPEFDDVYIDSVGGNRIKLQSEEDVNNKIEEALSISDF